MSDLIAAALKEIEKHAALHPEEAQKIASEKQEEKSQLAETIVELWKEEVNPNRLTIIEE